MADLPFRIDMGGEFPTLIFPNGTRRPASLEECELQIALDSLRSKVEAEVGELKSRRQEWLAVKDSAKVAIGPRQVADQYGYSADRLQALLDDHPESKGGERG